MFVVRPPAGPAAEFVRAAISWALANTSAYVPGESVSTRLPELVLIEVLRVHLATAPAVEHGWIAALRDPVLAPAMATTQLGVGAIACRVVYDSEEAFSRAFKRSQGVSPGAWRSARHGSRS